MLRGKGIPHQVLNAKYHEMEAQIIAEAGQPGRVTVSTNMAGRGTDIKLGPGVAEAGGLHVIGTERHDAKRVDRQLIGRAGRQDPPWPACLARAPDRNRGRRHRGGVRRRRRAARRRRAGGRRAHLAPAHRPARPRAAGRWAPPGSLTGERRPGHPSVT